MNAEDFTKALIEYTDSIIEKHVNEIKSGQYVDKISLDREVSKRFRDLQQKSLQFLTSHESPKDEFIGVSNGTTSVFASRNDLLNLYFYKEYSIILGKFNRLIQEIYPSLLE